MNHTYHKVTLKIRFNNFLSILTFFSVVIKLFPLAQQTTYYILCFARYKNAHNKSKRFGRNTTQIVFGPD